MDYEQFLQQKRFTPVISGLENIPELNAKMFPHQKDVTAWALRLGRAAVFLGTGIGKSLIELEWSRVVYEHTGIPVLFLAPLAVCYQMVREADKFGIKGAKYCHNSDEAKGTPIVITNYERLEHFDPSDYSGVVLDESSCLKAMDGVTKSKLIESFKDTPYRLAATATPAPNDHMELGNHSEFLGVMTATEMLSMFFTHDGGETQKWRLKGHARKEFWKWVCSWAVNIRRPSDAGYDDAAFVLPPLIYHEHIVDVDTPSEGMLFAMPAETLGERLAARRSTVKDRVDQTVSIIIESWKESRKHPTTANITELTKRNLMPYGSNGTQKTESEKSQRLSLTNPNILKLSGKLMCDINPFTSRSEENTRETITLPTEIILSPKLKHGSIRIKTECRTITSKKSTESESKNITECYPLRVEDAQYAEELIPAEGARTSTSTIVTQLEKSEDFCAEVVIKDSEDLMTTPNVLSGHIPTSKTQWIVWCNLNAEQDALAKILGNYCVSIYGSLSANEKIARFSRFERGEVAVLVTKKSIFGFGINMQFCWNQIFPGLDDSWEGFFQAVRRQWRFGQEHPVNVHLICASTEGNVLENLKRKEMESEQMADEMVANMQDLTRMNLRGTVHTVVEYQRDVKKTENWEMHLADCVDLAKEMENDSIHYSVYSPPFSSLYTYSNSERDMGNSRTDGQFWQHYKFLISETYRVMMSGRLVSIHCMNLPTSKVRDGYIGLRDFRGEIIKAFEEVGFIYHSEVCIWKDPVTSMQRTKALGLLHKTIRKDSAMARQGIPDYLVTMRKPGDNPEAISHSSDDFPVQLWQQYASPIWMDINPSDTLQYRSAREHNDERHIAPLQLEVIRRAVKLWSNPGDTVWSPFAGIGSEGFVSLEMGRKFIGSELKKSYYGQACRNLANALSASSGLFAEQDNEEIESPVTVDDMEF